MRPEKKKVLLWAAVSAAVVEGEGGTDMRLKQERMEAVLCCDPAARPACLGEPVLIRGWNQGEPFMCFPAECVGEFSEESHYPHHISYKIHRDQGGGGVVGAVSHMPMACLTDFCQTRDGGASVRRRPCDC